MTLVYGIAPDDILRPERQAFKNGIEPRLHLLTVEDLAYRQWVRVIPAFCLVSGTDGRLARFKRMSDGKWEIVIPVFSDAIALSEYAARDRAAWSFALTSNLKLTELFGDVELAFHTYHLYRRIFGDSNHEFMTVEGFPNQIYLVKYIAVNPERLLPDSVFKSIRWVEYQRERVRATSNPIAYDPITVSRLLSARH